MNVLLLVMLCCYLCVQAVTYQRTDIGFAFASPYCLNGPINDQPIITYLQHEHVSYVWARSFVGNPIAFKTNQSIIVSDPLATIEKNAPAFSGLNRIPAYTNAVLQADRPGILLVTRKPDHAARDLLNILAAHHIKYRTASFPAAEGYSVLVVLPLNATFAITTLTPADYLHIFLC